MRVEASNMDEVPSDYNSWPEKKRREYIIEWLQEYASPYRGVKLAEFRSEIIDSYLRER